MAPRQTMLVTPPLALIDRKDETVAASLHQTVACPTFDVAMAAIISSHQMLTRPTFDVAMKVISVRQIVIRRQQVMECTYRGDFAHNIPQLDRIARLWLDSGRSPADRVSNFAAKVPLNDERAPVAQSKSVNVDRQSEGMLTR